jgi:hypothetical protein
MKEKLGRLEALRVTRARGQPCPSDLFGCALERCIIMHGDEPIHALGSRSASEPLIYAIRCGISAYIRAVDLCHSLWDVGPH